jgi:hypothetical protein
MPEKQTCGECVWGTFLSPFMIGQCEYPQRPKPGRDLEVVRYEGKDCPCWERKSAAPEGGAK